jgi:hypothetical protein
LAGWGGKTLTLGCACLSGLLKAEACSVVFPGWATMGS